MALAKFKEYDDTVPCLIPNFDHSPRSGSKGVILHDSTPEKWGKFYRKVVRMVESRHTDNLIFIKAWNEWGEGNYLEPDLRFGTRYLEELSK